MVKVRSYELEHWVLFDTLNHDQVSRLKNIIDTKTAPATSRDEVKSVEPGASPFLAMLQAESAKLDRPS